MSHMLSSGATLWCICCRPSHAHPARDVLGTRFLNMGLLQQLWVYCNRDWGFQKISVRVGQTRSISRRPTTNRPSQFLAPYSRTVTTGRVSFGCQQRNSKSSSYSCSRKHYSGDAISPRDDYKHLRVNINTVRLAGIDVFKLPCLSRRIISRYVRGKCSKHVALVSLQSRG